MTGGGARWTARRAALLAIFIALAVGIGVGWFVADRARQAAEIPRVLVDATLPLRSEGAIFPFTLAEPSALEVEVHLPDMLNADVAVGPLYAAMRPELVYEPDAQDDVHFPIHGCSTAPFRHRFAKPGAYAVRVPGIPTAMGREAEMFVSVRVMLVSSATRQ